MAGIAKIKCLQFLFIALVFSIIFICANKLRTFQKQNLYMKSTSSDKVFPNIVFYSPLENIDSKFFVPRQWPRPDVEYGLRLGKNDPMEKTLLCPATENKTVQCYLQNENARQIDGYIIFASNFDSFPQYRNSNILWGLIYEEAPRVNPLFMNDKFFELFNFSATYSKYSDVPFPLLYLQAFKSERKDPIEYITTKKYYVNTTMKNYFLKELAPIMYLQSNSLTFNDRDEYVLKLMEYIDIDSYGESVNNRKLPKNFQCDNSNDNAIKTLQSEFMHYTARYKFQIAIESGVCADYISEKLWRPIEQGVVPIYFGSQTIRDWLPNKKSAILIEDFDTPELLARYLHDLLKNDTKYEEYLEHKTNGLISNKKLIKEFISRPHQFDISSNVNELICVMCRRLHEVNSSKINIVSRKARDCKMPWSLIKREPDPNNTYMEVIDKAIRIADDVYQNYVKRIPLGEKLNNAFCLFLSKPNLTDWSKNLNSK